MEWAHSGFLGYDGTWRSIVMPLEELQTIGLYHSYWPRGGSRTRLTVPPGLNENALRRENMRDGEPHQLPRRVAW